MAENVSKVFKPRRGLKSTMTASGKSSIVLQKGEMFLEAPSTGMGTGASKIKIGDGTTAYSSLPYALGDTSNDKIDFSSNTATTVATALNSVTSGNALKTIIAGLKQAISLCNTSITQLNDDNGGLKFAQDTEGNWGYITPGADTVNPFKTGDGTLIYIDSIDMKDQVTSATKNINYNKTETPTYLYDCTSINGYQNLTNEDFKFILSSFFISATTTVDGGGWAGVRLYLNKIYSTYEQSSGSLTISTEFKCTLGSNSEDGYFGIGNFVIDIYIYK